MAKIYEKKTTSKGEVLTAISVDQSKDGSNQTVGYTSNDPKARPKVRRMRGDVWDQLPGESVVYKKSPFGNVYSFVRVQNDDTYIIKAVDNGTEYPLSAKTWDGDYALCDRKGNELVEVEADPDLVEIPEKPTYRRGDYDKGIYQLLGKMADGRVKIKLIKNFDPKYKEAVGMVTDTDESAWQSIYSECDENGIFRDPKYVKTVLGGTVYGWDGSTNTSDDIQLIVAVRVDTGAELVFTERDWDKMVSIPAGDRAVRDAVDKRNIDKADKAAANKLTFKPEEYRKEKNSTRLTVYRLVGPAEPVTFDSKPRVMVQNITRRDAPFAVSVKSWESLEKCDKDGNKLYVVGEYRKDPTGRVFFVMVQDGPRLVVQNNQNGTVVNVTVENWETYVLCDGGGKPLDGSEKPSEFKKGMERKDREIRVLQEQLRYLKEENDLFRRDSAALNQKLVTEKTRVKSKDDIIEKQLVEARRSLEIKQKQADEIDTLKRLNDNQAKIITELKENPAIEVNMEMAKPKLDFEALVNTPLFKKSFGFSFKRERRLGVVTQNPYEALSVDGVGNVTAKNLVSGENTTFSARDWATMQPDGPSPSRISFDEAQDETPSLTGKRIFNFIRKNAVNDGVDMAKWKDISEESKDVYRDTAEDLTQYLGL